MSTRMERLVNSHINKIVKIFGKELANSANIGWVQEPGAYTSKIYTSPRSFVSSYYEGGKIVHECVDMRDNGKDAVD